MSGATQTRYPDSFRKVHLSLAREADHPDGEDSISYELIAPLDADGHLDSAQWKAHRHLCRVVRFRPNESPEIGHLVRRPGGNWMFRYDLVGDDDDEPGYRFDEEIFVVGEYVSIAEHDAMHTYRVVSIDRP